MQIYRLAVVWGRGITFTDDFRKDTKKFQTDNGSEFLNGKFKVYYAMTKYQVLPQGPWFTATEQCSRETQPYTRRTSMCNVHRGTQQAWRNLSPLDLI